MHFKSSIFGQFFFCENLLFSIIFNFRGSSMANLIPPRPSTSEETDDELDFTTPHEMDQIEIGDKSV